MGNVRRRLIAAQPHLVTASGSSVLVNIAEPKIERLAVTFSPVQTGSGTPSPSNVRPIYGYSTIAASIGTMPVDISLGGTYYGGVVDLVGGVMTVTWGNIASYSGQTLPGRWLSSKDAYSPGGTPTTGAQVAYELATPQTVTLTPQTIAALRGQQTVTSPAGAVEIGYWAQDDRTFSIKKWIVLTGTQYIETGFVPQPGDEFAIDYNAPTKRSYQALASAGTGSRQFIIMPTTDYCSEQGVDPNLFYESYFRYFSTSSAVCLCDANYGTPYSASVTSTGKLTINGADATTVAAGELDGDDTTLWLGRRRNNQQSFYGYIGETTITRNGIVVLHCVPAESGGVAGMYETVSGRFLTNQGTGTITTL